MGILLGLLGAAVLLMLMVAALHIGGFRTSPVLESLERRFPDLAWLLGVPSFGQFERKLQNRPSLRSPLLSVRRVTSILAAVVFGIGATGFLVAVVVELV